MTHRRAHTPTLVTLSVLLVGRLLVAVLHLLTVDCVIAVQVPLTYNPDGCVRILAVDCGMKNNQIRCLCERGASVTVVPWDHCLSDMGRWALFLCVTVFKSILWCLCERGGFSDCRAMGPLPFRHGSVGIVSLCYCV